MNPTIRPWDIRRDYVKAPFAVLCDKKLSSNDGIARG